MGHLHLSLPVGHRHAADAHEGAAGGSAPRVTLEFFDEAGERVGARLRPVMPAP